MTKPVIYTSEWLRTTQKTAGVAKAIFAALDEQKVEHRELVNTNDYWCRDYMPVKLFDDGTYAKYEYRFRQSSMANEQDSHCKCRHDKHEEFSYA